MIVKKLANCTCSGARALRVTALVALSWAALLQASAARAFPLVVQPGDTLAGIAQRIYGRAAYERVLVSANGLDVGRGLTIVPGMRLEVPALSYRRVARGDTWAGIAERWLGGPHRAAVLAFANDSKPWLRPTENAEILIPYNLRVVTREGDSLLDIAERFLGKRRRAWMLAGYNGLKGAEVEPGTLVLVPLVELPLTAAGQEAAARALEGWGNHRGEQRAQQEAADDAVRVLLADVRAGRYVEAVARGTELLAGFALTTPQRAAVQRQLLEAYAALGASGRATDACLEWRRAAPRARLDPRLLSPKLLAACRAAPQ